MIEQILQMIAEKMKLSHTNLEPLQAPMRNIIFFYNYKRYIDPQYETYPHKYLNKVIEEIQKVNTIYADDLADIGTGIEYLAQHSYIDDDTNEILSDFDKILFKVLPFQTNLIDTRTGIISYGKYYLARLKNPGNNKNINPNTKLIQTQLSKIVDLLSADYGTFESLCSVIDFLPDLINLDINKEKAIIFFNYAVDLLETKVYEDIFWNKYPSTFNPLITSLLISRASQKIKIKNLANRELFFRDI
ncbi:MAG: hypothetical protein LUH15_05065 [Tannerellaceae bacterium]|nr:hypothetical protein [Tannerellaceae bacterium]